MSNTEDDNVGIRPPFRCVLCGEGKEFRSEEHIIPESLGNDLVVLAPGWICDSCNNICSSFESRVLSSSILGVERCRLGVITKKRKPAFSRSYGIGWFAEPRANPNVVSCEANWDRVPIMWSTNGAVGKIAIRLHDASNYDVCRLLLKIGIELVAVVRRSRESCASGEFSSARDVVLGRNQEPWPYAVLTHGIVPSQMCSVFTATPEEHEYVRSCGFDLFLHEIDEHKVLAFQYGRFAAAVSICSRSLNWVSVLRSWNTSFVCCPAEFQGTTA